RRAEPDRDRPVPLQIRAHPRTLLRPHTQPQRPAVRRHLRPPSACELGPQVVVARGDPHGNAAVDELDHCRIEHRRQPCLLHQREPIPPTNGRPTNRVAERARAMSFDVATGQEVTREQEGFMRRLILQTSISIDGYVAALDKSHPWGVEREDEGVKRWILNSVWAAGAHLMGRVTYEEMA